jgi:hypothetical protein
MKRVSRGMRYALLCTLPFLWSCTPNTTASKATTPEYSYSTPSTGNVTHDMLLAKPADVRASVLAHIVESSGDLCTGTKAFFMGLNPKDNEAYWSVRCTNGKSYEVAIKADAFGHTSVVDCAIMKAMADVDCFVKMDDQQHRPPRTKKQMKADIDRLPPATKKEMMDRLRELR